MGSDPETFLVFAGKKNFRQVVGIPMGSGPETFLVFANLFLCHYENRWIKKIKRADLKHAWWFANLFLVIDGLAALNISGDFERSYKDIYPP